MKSGILRTLLLAACLVLAVVLGKFGGDAALAVSWLKWLGYSVSFGFGPAVLDINILQLTLGLHLSLNVLQGILVVAVILFYASFHRRGI